MSAYDATIEKSFFLGILYFSNCSYVFFDGTQKKNKWK